VLGVGVEGMGLRDDRGLAFDVAGLAYALVGVGDGERAGVAARQEVDTRQRAGKVAAGVDCGAVLCGADERNAGCGLIGPAFVNIAFAGDFCSNVTSSTA